MLKMQSVKKIYRTDMIETHALRDFNLEVKEGEFVAVTGPSGSGKTTFLNIAGLLETFEEGHYLLDGQDVSRLNDNVRSKLRNEKIGFIFQGFNLISDLNIFDNVDVPLRYRGFSSSERKKRINNALEMVGLVALARLPHPLHRLPHPPGLRCVPSETRRARLETPPGERRCCSPWFSALRCWSHAVAGRPTRRSARTRR